MIAYCVVPHMIELNLNSLNRNIKHINTRVNFEQKDKCSIVFSGIVIISWYETLAGRGCDI